MKLQFGILHRDQRPANLDGWAIMLGDYDTWVPETAGQYFDGPLFMGYRGDRITWEEDTETQPFSLGPFTLSFDGRLDNRGDLAAKVGLTVSSSLPDPVLLAEAYAKHGDSIFPELIGEFSLVLWRSDARELTFCRSVDGARPLYYLLDRTRLLWSSQVDHLVRISDIEPQLNNRYVWEYLLGAPSSGITPFAAVNGVEAGTVLRFRNDSLLPPTKLWDPRHIQPLALKSDAEYEERLRHEIKQAVRARLRAKAIVFADLSGGLDSSSVVLIADETLRASNRDSRCLQTVSMLYEQSRTTDESYFIRLVETARGLKSIYISEQEQRFTTNFRNLTFTGLPSPYDLTPGRYTRYTEHMQERGSQVLLTGAGGDHIFCSTPCPEVLVADSVQKGNLAEAHRVCRLWSQMAGLSYFNLLLTKALPIAISPSLPASWRYDSLEVPSWLNLNGHKELAYARSSNRPERHLQPSHWIRVWQLDCLFRCLSMGLWSKYPGLYVSHPYSHRPLVEYCISVPMKQMQRNGETRSLLRRAFASILPAKIMRRQGKGLLHEPFSRAIQHDWSELSDVNNWRLCADGYVRPTELDRSLRDMRMGLSTSCRPTFVPVALSLERFLRSLPLLKRAKTTAGTNLRAESSQTNLMASHSTPLIN